LPARPGDGCFGSGLAGRAAPGDDDLNGDAVDRVVLINRARLQALHQARASSPAVADAFFAWFWVLFVFIGIGAATQVLVDLRIAWAAGVSFGVEFIGLGLFLWLLERHEQAIIRRAGGRIAPRPPFSWRHLSPPHLLHRAHAHLDALSIDDSELEDRLDALVRAGCDSYDLRPLDQTLGRASQPRVRK
jgi:hypothetical protein